MLAAPSPLTPWLFGQPQFEKPPLTYWLLAASFTLFGEHPRRCSPASFGVLGALLAFLGRRFFFRAGVAALGALLLLTSIAYLGQSVALLTDMVFTTLLAGSLLRLLPRGTTSAARRCTDSPSSRAATLTKGPVASSCC